MLGALALLSGMQLLGTVLARGLGVPVPGPVLGFVLLALLLGALPKLRAPISPTITTLLRHLPLLFVPAAVGVMQQETRLRAEWVAVLAAVILSTWATMTVTSLVFRALSRRLDRAGDAPTANAPATEA